MTAAPRACAAAAPVADDTSRETKLRRRSRHMCLPPSGREDLSVEADGRLGTAAPRACAAAAPASDDTSQRRSRVVGALAPRPETYVLFLFLHLVFPHLVFESCSSLLAIWFSWQRLTEAGSRRCGGCCHLTKKGWRLPRGRSRKTTSPFAPGLVTGGLGFSRQHPVTTPVQNYRSR